MDADAEGTVDETLEQKFWRNPPRWLVTRGGLTDAIGAYPDLHWTRHDRNIREGEKKTQVN